METNKNKIKQNQFKVIKLKKKMEIQEMADKLAKHTEQYDLLKETLNMDFILFLQLVSEPIGELFIENLLQYIKNTNNK